LVKAIQKPVIFSLKLGIETLFKLLSFPKKPIDVITRAKTNLK